MNIKKAAHVLLVAFIAALFSGCATYDQNVMLIYNPAADAKGGSGELYLTTAGKSSGMEKPGKIKWIIGKATYADWRQAGDVVSNASPADIVSDALYSELGNAGYSVRRVSRLPENVPKGIVLTIADITLDDDNSIIKDEVSCRVNISLELWKHGEKVKKVDYRSKFSDATVNGMEMTFLGTVLQNALQNAMKQAVPDIIRQMEI
ncbi:MAG: hypothetical protein VB050_08100 [Geobacteraceae bacterium]|nr:hypothetical protein [Geobacteraceae bacterium]